MTFREAVGGTPSLRDAYRQGLQALSARDAKRLRVKDSRRLTGRVNLDEALRAAQPEAPRWDYGIGYRHSHQEEAIWLEVHPASSRHVDEVLTKLRWLHEWLKGQAPDLHKLTRAGFYWIATDGQVALSRHSPQARRLAKAGLRGPWRVLHLPPPR